MAEFSEGYDGGPYMAESGWSSTWDAAMSSGPYPTSIANLQVFTDADGRQIKVRSGSGIMRGHPYRSDATKAIALAPNTSGVSRIDTVVLRLDTVAKKTTIEVRQGVASGTPVRPTLLRQPTGVWEEPLAAVTLANNFTNVASGDISDERGYAIAGWQAGDIKPWPSETVPLGWHLCDDSDVRRDAWPRTAAVLLPAFDNGLANFVRLPNLRNSVIVGAATVSGSTYAVGERRGGTTASNTDSGSLLLNYIIRML